MKRCRVCGKEKPLGDYPRDRSKYDGLASRCRTCDRARSKAQYEKNAQKRRAIAKARSEEARVGSVRQCANCGEPATSARHHYCDTCRPQRRPRHAGKTAERGYGAKHVKERKRWLRVVRAGKAFCARCGGWIEPGSDWHLDHTDDREGYLGPSHADCNEKAAQRPKRRTQPRSRDWYGES